MPRRPDPARPVAAMPDDGVRRGDRWFPRLVRRGPGAAVPSEVRREAPHASPTAAHADGASRYADPAARAPFAPFGPPPAPGPPPATGPPPAGDLPPASDLPPEADLLTRSGGRRAFRYGPRIVVPRRGRGGTRSGARLLLRAGSGSLGAALFLGVFLGRLFSTSGDSLVSVEYRGPGRLDPASAAALEPGFFADAEGLRRQLAAIGPVERVRVLPTGEGGARVVVEEKRAAAILLADEDPASAPDEDPATGNPAAAGDPATGNPAPRGPGGGPPLALAADGALLGPATAADLSWAEAADLPVIRGADPAAPDFAARAAVAGRLAGELAAAPELDRRVSELRVAGAPALVEVVLRDPPGLVVVTAAEADASGSGSAAFRDSLERALAVLPDLRGRWPDLERLDARLPDRLLARRRSTRPRDPNPGEEPAPDPGAGPANDR